jgi:hypothetical protein
MRILPGSPAPAFPRREAEGHPTGFPELRLETAATGTALRFAAVVAALPGNGR